MTKMEKLNEVNLQLTHILNQIETRMFIENIKDKKITEKKPELIVEIKQ